MKNLALWFALAQLPIASVWASWNNATDSVLGSKVTVDKADGKRVYLELIPGKPVNLDLEKKISTRWKIFAEAKGMLYFAKDGETPQSKILAKGDNDLKIFLEAGKYRIKSTIGAKAQCYFWKKRELTSLVPDGGGYAVYMQAGTQKFAYYRAAKDTMPVLSLTGPSKAYIFFRADMPKGLQKTTADVAVKENDSVVEHKISELIKSEKAEASEDSAHAISEAMVLSISVPAGKHKYSVHTNKCSGFVKFYKSGKKKKNKFSSPVGLNGSDRNGSEPTVDADLGDNDEEGISEADLIGEEESAKVENRRAMTYRLYASLGAGFDNNVYLYSPGFIDTYNQGLKTYRYQDVSQLGDIVLPLDTKASATVGDYTARIGMSVDAYASNTNLNNIGFMGSLEWAGPIRLITGYSFKPYDPVRPTYISPRTYRFMSYSENKGTLSAQLHRLPLKPVAEFSFGYFNYNRTFNNYDAQFYEGGLAISRQKSLGFRVDTKVGAVYAKKHTAEDWSNQYFGAGLDGHFPIRSIILGARSSIVSRNYATTDSVDTHYNRKDLSGEGYLYLKYDWKSFGVKARTGFLWRATSSPLPAIDEEKDYQGIKGGIELSWEMSA